MKNKTETENENEIRLEIRFDWRKVNLKEWETPQAELEKSPEYQHLQKVCRELGLSL